MAILEELCLIGADNSVARVRTLIRAIGSSFNFTTPVVTVAYIVAVSSRPNSCTGGSSSSGSVQSHKSQIHS